jgi:hypothetical protein
MGRRINIVRYLLLLFLAIGLEVAQAQEIDVKKVKLEIGYSYLSNFFNDNEYYSSISSSVYDLASQSMNGAYFALTRETKYSYLDLVVGMNFMLGPVDSNYNLNGGGIYAGIRPQWKGKYIGLTSEFAIGIFSFKEYISDFDNQRPPIVNINQQNASGGLGAKTSFGFYLQSKRLGIHPTADAIFSGGGNASFLFYGFTVPLTITF